MRHSHRLVSWLCGWRKGSVGRAIGAGAVAAVLTNGLRLPICWLYFRVRMAAVLQLLYPFFWYLVVCALGVAMQGAFLILLWKRRANGIRDLLWAITYMVLSICFVVLSDKLYFHEAGRIPGGTSGLVAAIHAFEDAHGGPPVSLGALVPEYLERVPHPSGGTRYEYFVGTYRDGYPKNRWGLVIQLPNFYVWMGEDRLVYLADGNHWERADVIDGWAREIWDD